MNGEQFAGVIIMALCAFGCAAIFLGISLRALRSEKPVSFWSGKNVDARDVKDIPGYNQACASMWKVYSVPYWAAGVLGCLGFLGEGYLIGSACVLALACFPGLILLIFRYRQIEKEYISR